MNFQIHQLEKAQALDLLDRVTTRLVNEANELRDDDEGRDTAIETLTCIYRNVDGLRTQLDARESQLSIADLANLFHGFDTQHSYRSAVEYFATYFSNFNTDKIDFLLAAGYALRPVDELLREDEDEINWRIA